MKKLIFAMLGLCAVALSPVVMTSRAQAQVNCSGVAAWSANSVSYAVGALVTYNGSEYKCLQAHTSQAGWDPADVPALWSDVGTCSSTTGTTTGSTTGTCSASPGAPTGLSASSTTQTGTTLKWTAPTPPANCTISSYTIYKSGTSIGTSTTASFNVTGLTAGTTYTFTVAATDSSGTGAQSSSVSVTTSSASCSAVPSAPTGLAASSTTSSGTTLNWSAVTPPANCSISSYTIYKSGTSIGTSTSTSFAVTGLTASTTYSFTVAATDSDGTGSQSSSVSVTTSASSGPACWAAWVSTTAYNGGAQVSYNGENYQAAYWTQGNNPSTNSGPAGSGEEWIPEGACGGGASCTSTPPAPTGLAASSTTQTGTTLNWTAPTAPANCSISGYTVYKSGTSIGTATGTSFSVTGLTAGTSYSFTVAATDADGTGSQSSSISVTTQSAANCTTLPGAPSGLAASGTTSSSTTLNWNSVTAPTNCTISGYTVYKGGAALATVSSGTSYTVTGLSASTGYSFTVAAVDGDGTGSQSSSVSVTTTAQQQAGPITNDVIGYWDNWGTFTMPNTSMNYEVLNYAFAVGSGTDGATLVMWTPSATNPLSNAAADIASTKAQGRTVLLSLGGATSPNITLLNSTDVSNFVSSVEGLVSQYGFQGIDLDFENSSVTVNSGDSLSSPTTPDIVNLASALHQIKSHFGSSFIITYVPETADIDAYSAVGGEWGGYLYLINATRDILTYSDTQCYDSGSMDAANGQVVSEGGADFMVAMSELLLHGYTISGGQNFAALSPSQVAFGNLYNGTAASTSVAAYKYLTTGASDGGSYTLIGGPYPNMAGSMVWDINGDQTTGYAYSNTLVSGGLK